MHFACVPQSQPEEPTPVETPPEEVKEPVVDNDSEPYPEDDISEEEDEDDEDDYHEDDDKVRVWITQKPEQALTSVMFRSAVTFWFFY